MSMVDLYQKQVEFVEQSTKLYLDALVKKRVNSVLVDDYGDADYSSWFKELKFFIDRKIRKIPNKLEMTEGKKKFLEPYEIALIVDLLTVEEIKNKGIKAQNSEPANSKDLIKFFPTLPIKSESGLESDLNTTDSNSKLATLHDGFSKSPPNQQESKITCPNCNSDEWKSAEFMYKTGLTIIDTNSKTDTVGVGVSKHGLGVGISEGVSNTKGTYQTIISAELTPPKEPINDQPIIYWVIVIITSVLFGLKSELIGWVIFIVALVFWFKSVKERVKEDYEKRLEQYKISKSRWDATRVCQRCGHVYIPAFNTNT